MVVYLKLSDFCNIGCSHCYLPVRNRENKMVMNITILHKAIADLKMMCMKGGFKHLVIVLHGGEPMLVDHKIVVEYIKIIKKAFGSGSIKVEFSIQTSLIPLNKAWINVIKEYFGSNVCVSVDFSARTISGSVERYMSALKKRIALCKSEGIFISANVVVCKDTLGRASEIVDWFIEHEILDVDFSRYNSYGKNDLNQPTNREHSLFLSDLMDDSISRFLKGGVVPLIQTINCAVMVAIKGVGGGTWGAGCLSGSYVINPDGTTNSCPDRISYEQSFTDGGVPFTQSIYRAKTIIEGAQRSSSRVCSGCEYVSVCKGGCPIEHNDPLKNGDCAGFRALLDYTRKLYDEDGGARLCMDMVIDYECR